MRNTPCIIIADDDEMSLDILSTRLASEGYEVLSVSDGKAALSLVREKLPDLVILDVMMPGMDGVEVCQRIKNEFALDFIPVIIVTAKVDRQDILRGLESGADEYLLKPVDHQALLARVNSVLKIKKLFDLNQMQAKKLKEQAAHLEESNAQLSIQLVQEKRIAEIGRLIGDIGHDIKNMMMPILNSIDLLKEEFLETLNKLPVATQREAVASKNLLLEITDIVRRNIRRIQERVKEMGDAVKGRSTPPIFSSCDISKVVDAVFETLKVYANENHVTLKCEGLEILPRIEADESRLFNMIYNLVNNAIAEIPGEGSVSMRGEFEPQKKLVVLLVSDTGKGMSREFMESLFTNKAISTKRGGTGLGTKIVKDAVDAHGGTISVESEKGKGTTFCITLPLQQQPRNSTAISEV